jgi:BCD family chlorophyll transporter-like MFS transporter
MLEQSQPLPQDKPTENLPIGRNLKIAFFHLGSGMADVLTTGVWNRVMISDLGFAATPIGLLVALRYFLAPLGIWAGRISDQRALFGFRRLSWIWGGRLLMVLSTFLLGATTAQIATHGALETSALEWLAIVASLLMFSIGSTISGTTFLALVYDRTPEHQRGRSVGIVWTFLLLGFTVGGILFGRLLPDDLPEGAQAIATRSGSELAFTPEALGALFMVAGIAFAALWVFSLLGEEKRTTAPADTPTPAPDKPARTVWQDLSLVWTSIPMRFFLFYLTVSMFFAFSQDLVLEPFAGDVFNMPASTTNRFSAYWGSMAILGTIVFLWLSRRYRWLTNSVMSQAGVVVLILAFVMLAVSSFAQIRGLITPTLIVLGIGLGIWNVGTLGLMMDLSPLGKAGTFLGFWTMAVTLARGGGVASGGIFRDAVLAVSGDFSVTYGMVFLVGAIGLTISAICLLRVNVARFKRDAAQSDVATIFAGAMD